MHKFNRKRYKKTFSFVKRYANSNKNYFCLKSMLTIEGYKNLIVK